MQYMIRVGEFIEFYCIILLYIFILLVFLNCIYLYY